MNSGPYKARQHYQDSGVAGDYDDIRFRTWYGKLAHEAEEHALKNALGRYASEPGTLLDLPCGTGRLFDCMLRQNMRITGGDISDAMMSLAKKRYGTDARVSFQKADAEKLPFPDREFDYLTSYRLMCHLPPPVRKKVLDEMVRVTKKVLIVNYHFDCASALYLFNRLFRPLNLPSYPLREKELVTEIHSRGDVELLNIIKLSWWERSSALVIMRRKDS